MNRRRPPARNRRAAGFTLVELAIVVVIIGVLSALAVPHFMTTVERTKAAEAFDYLQTVQSAQQRYHARQGQYADDLAKLDVKLPAPSYFAVGTMAVPSGASSFETGWELTLTRSGAASGFGSYTVVFDQDGYDLGASTIADDITPYHTSS
jgi:prepilin-type N-terminal cleavage/methylation domain-containing protein